MSRNCVAAIVVWVVLFAGYTLYFFRSDLPIEGALLGGALMSFTTGLGLAMINSARIAAHDRNALARFQRGMRPRDNELVAVSGQILPTFEPLHAPFSERECVAYRYDIGPVRGGDPSVARDYAGFAATRCAIHTPYGTYNIGSFPVLNGFPEERGDPRAFVEATEFQEFTSVLDMAKYTLNLHRQPLPLRVDWRIGEPSPGVKEAKETIVASGATVTAYGVYSSTANALVSDTKARGELRLFAGSTTALPPRAVAQFLAGLMVIVVAHAVMALVLNKLAAL